MLSKVPDIKNKLKNICKIAAIALSSMVLAVPVMADVTIDPNVPCSLTIQYNDTVDGNDAVAGALFHAYKVAEIGSYGNYESVVPGLSFSEYDAQNAVYVDEYTDPGAYVPAVLDYYGSGSKGGAMYHCTTGQDGMGIMQGMESGAYLVYETKAAPHHIETTPFLISLPFKSENVAAYGWTYDMTCQPKSTPTGDLSVTKTLKGDDVETDREFHFDITFNNDRPYTCYKNGQKYSEIRGKGTVSAKGGETVEIRDIPAGTLYAVTEQEADKDGYKTEATGSDGHITKYQMAKAEFTNTREKQPTPTPTVVPVNGTPNNGGYYGGAAGAGPIQTGDENIYLYMALAILSIAVIAKCALSGKRNRNNL